MILISATDKNWPSSVVHLFEQRVQFEITDIDTSESHGERIFNDFAKWCFNWHYTPKLVNVRSIRFTPKEFRRERSNYYIELVEEKHRRDYWELAA